MKTTCLYFVLMLSFLVACKNQHNSANKTKIAAGQNVTPADSPVVVLTRGACYGKCPAYTMRIFGNGKARFEGRRFVSKIGIYEKELGMAVLNDLVARFENADVWDMKSNYASMATDLPGTRIYFYHNGKSKTIDGIYNAPQSLQDIMKALYDIGDSTNDWKKISDLPGQK